MSVQEIESLAQQFCDAFNKKDLKKALDMLSDDLEVFDHVPYRFDNKEQFAQFMSGAIESISSMNFGFRHPSCCVFNDETGIVNRQFRRRRATGSARAIEIGSILPLAATVFRNRA